MLSAFILIFLCVLIVIVMYHVFLRKKHREHTTRYIVEEPVWYDWRNWNWWNIPYYSHSVYGSTPSHYRPIHHQPIHPMPIHHDIHHAPPPRHG